MTVTPQKCCERILVETIIGKKVGLIKYTIADDQGRGAVNVKHECIYLGLRLLYHTYSMLNLVVLEILFQYLTPRAIITRKDNTNQEVPASYPISRHSIKILF
jgi:hypothetical protein